MLCLFIGAKRRARIACAVMSLVIAFTAWVSWQMQTGSAVRFAVCGEESVLLFSGNTACVLQLGEDDAVSVIRALEENGVIVGGFGVSGGTAEQDTALADYAKEFYEKELI